MIQTKLDLNIVIYCLASKMIFRIMCILIVIRKSSTEADVYYENSKRTSWTEAQNNCALATPVFRSELGENVVNITNTVTTDLWVGYFKALIEFEYKGCIRNVNLKPRIELTILTIGRCYSECGRKQLVGISGRNCYCEDQINFDEDYLSTLCYSYRNCNASVCNTCDENDCVSIYKVDKNVTKDRRLKIDEGMCLKMNAVPNKETLPNKRYAWIDCGQHNHAFCNFGDSSLSSERSDSWRESANWCFALKGYPFTYAELKTTNDSFTNPIWTSITCSYVIYTYKEYDNNLSNIRFGHLTSKNSRTVLQFKDESTTQKRALCTNESPETSTRTLSTPEKHGSTDMDLSEQSSTSSKPETESETTSIEMSSDPGFDELNTEKNAENQDPNDSAIIATSVGSTLFVIAVAVVVVVLKRRNKLQTLCKGNPRDTKSHDTSSDDITNPVTQEKHSHDHVVYKTKNDVNQSDDTNFLIVKQSCIDDTTYNTTFSTKTNKEMESRNIYNKLELDTNATYDHAQKKRQIDHSKSDDTYDTTELEAFATKVDNKPNKFGGRNEDPYNHIDGKQLKTCQTDNVYGVPHYLGNIPGKAGTRHERDPLCGVDTYSHISNKTLKSRKSDNAYDVPNHLNASSGESSDQEGHYDVTDTDI